MIHPVSASFLRAGALAGAALWLFSLSPAAYAHGIGGRLIREVAEEEGHDHDHGHSHEGHDHAAHAAGGKSFKEALHEDHDQRWWAASLETGWTSREVHYGVDETGNYGAYTTELAVQIHRFTVSAWSGFGTGNDYQEWNFNAAYTAQVGPLFITPGYNFRYVPEEDEHEDGHDESHDEEGHDEHEEGDGHDHDHEAHDDEEHDHGHSHAGHAHAHKVYNNELFLTVGTTEIPYVTPSTTVVWNLNDTPGVYLEFRVDGEVPVYRDVVTLNPYALLGLNFGYNTTDEYGWNNFQFGLEADWKITKNISLYGGVNYSVAMTALRAIDQGNVVWANAGVRFVY